MTMQSTYDETEFIAQVAKGLGVLAEGQTIDTDVSTEIAGHIGAVFLSLASLNVVDVSDSNAIPAEYFLDLADCVADACAPSFGKPQDPGMRAQAEDRLRAMTRIAPAARQTADMDLAMRRYYPYTYYRWRY